MDKIKSGGWASLMNCENHTCLLYSGVKDTTNNRMELSAAIWALAQLNVPCVVNLHSDSRYVVDAINKRWIEKWQRNNWKTVSGEPVKNIQLWIQLSLYLNYHEVKAFWIKGHNGHIENELCDTIAKSAALSMIS